MRTLVCHGNPLPIPNDPPPQPETGGEYWVPVYNLPTLGKKMEKLVRRGQKLGVPVSYTVTDERYTWVQQHRRDNWGDTLVISHEYAKVIVAGTAPKFEGWRLIARLLHESQTGLQGVNIVNAVPGERCPEQYRTASCKCEHCNKNWVVRKDTFVILHDNGTYKQVGSNCIADFLGHRSPEELIALFRFVTDGIKQAIGGGDGEQEWPEPEGLFVRGAITLRLEEVLTFVQSYTRVFGWVTAKEAQGSDKSPSSPTVRRLMLAKVLSRYEQEDMDRLRAATTPELAEKDAEYAEQAIQWASQIDARSDFEHNIKSIANARTVSERTYGAACAIIGAYRRHIEKATTAQAEQARAEKRPSQHVGEVKQRLTLEVIVKSVTPITTGFGASFIHRMEDREGNSLVWFATKSGDKLPVGEWTKIVATVKQHGEYRGQKQTGLTRVDLPAPEKTEAEQAAEKATQKARAKERRETDRKLLALSEAAQRALLASQSNRLPTITPETRAELGGLGLDSTNGLTDRDNGEVWINGSWPLPRDLSSRLRVLLIKAGKLTDDKVMHERFFAVPDFRRPYNVKEIIVADADARAERPTGKGFGSGYGQFVSEETQRRFTEWLHQRDIVDAEGRYVPGKFDELVDYVMRNRY